MSNNEVVVIESTTKRGWFSALTLFIRDEKAGLVSRMLFRFVPAYLLIPFGVADDATGVGVADDLPTALLIVYMLWRVSKYR
jgi:hypothetical protein